MNTDQPNERGTNQVPEQTPPESQNHHSDESTLVRLFSEITGESESEARCAFMFISRDDEKPNNRPSS
jgi:hypothetical protein